MTEEAVVVQELEKSGTPVKDMAESEPVRQTEDNEINDHSQNPDRKKKKKKHRKHVHKVHKDPEEIKQIRMEKMNMKREVKWNARFINDTIPDLFASKPKKKKSEAPIKRNKSPIQTVYLDKDLLRHKLPHLNHRDKQEQAKQTQKSFNIRTLGAKKHHKKHKKHHGAAKSEQGDSLIPIIEGKLQSKVVEQPNEKFEDKLRAKLEEKTKIHPVHQHYKHTISQLITLYAQTKGKELKTLIQHEITSIGHPKNAYSQISKMVKERRKQIDEITKSGQNTTLGAYLNFQIMSISLIEQILKFKAKWEEQYHNANRPCKIQYRYDKGNYLFEIGEQVKGLCQDVSDPFLVGKTHKLQQLVGSALKQDEQKERRQMLLKIRACELLLIEEELLQD